MGGHMASDKMPEEKASLGRCDSVAWDAGHDIEFVMKKKRKHDEKAYVLGCANLMFTVALLAKFPEYFWIWHCLKVTESIIARLNFSSCDRRRRMRRLEARAVAYLTISQVAVLLPLRYIDYKQEGDHYFLLDFCYMTSYGSCFLVILAFLRARFDISSPLSECAPPKKSLTNPDLIFLPTV